MMSHRSYDVSSLVILFFSDLSRWVLMFCPSVHCFVLLLHPVWCWIPLVTFQSSYSAALFVTSVWCFFFFTFSLSLLKFSLCLSTPLPSSVSIFMITTLNSLSGRLLTFALEGLLFLRFYIVLFCFWHISVQICLILHVRWISYLPQSWRRCLCSAAMWGFKHNPPGHQSQTPMGISCVACMLICCGGVEDAVWVQVGANPDGWGMVVAWRLLGHSHSC